MLSKYSHLKEAAIQMRIKGISLVAIHKELGIPKSTLSPWLKPIALTTSQIDILMNNQRQALQQARIKAIIWHKEHKKFRIQEAENKAKLLLSCIDLQDKNIQELALALLYLGEGFKSDQQLGMGNSNPLILRFFIKVYLANFKIERTSIKCDLYLRADQDLEEIKAYWAKELNLPIENFIYSHWDKRTVGSRTRSTYKGVCTVRCSHLAVKRKIMYIAEKYCEVVIKGG